MRCTHIDGETSFAKAPLDEQSQIKTLAKIEDYLPAASSA